MILRQKSSKRRVLRIFCTRNERAGKNKLPEATFCVILQDAERNTLAIERNRTATELAEKYSLPITDLYNSPALQRKDLYRDIVHQTEEGYEILGKIVSDKIREVLGK